MGAISIHIGLNNVDSTHYQGWSGQLRACENDAKDMQAIAITQGYDTKLFLSKEATASAVLQALAEAADELLTGDTLLLTYSGHGGQIPDVNGDEVDGLDETWVLYDRMLVDDELYNVWSQFRPGVEILMLSDSCHSGTMAKVIADAMPNIRITKAITDNDEVASRAIPENIQKETYVKNQGLYDSVQWSNSRGDKVVIGASIILISGCQDNQTSADGLKNGLFTASVLQVWNSGSFRGSHDTFWKHIVSIMPFYQSPNYYKVGLHNPEFEQKTPFSLSINKSLSINNFKSYKPIVNMAKYQFFLDVNQGLSANPTEDQIRSFLQKDGCDTLLSAFKKTQSLSRNILSSEVSIPKDSDGTVSCTASSNGTVSCTASVTVHF